MNTVTESKVMTVGELAAEVPTSIRVFEAWKIDYCCGGRTPLPEACAAAGRSVEGTRLWAIVPCSSCPPTAGRRVR